MKLPSDDQVTLEYVQEQLADSDSEWWPFVFLRPEQHENLTMTRCAVLSLLYGAPASLCAAVAGELVGEPMQRVSFSMFLLGVSALAFVLLRLGVASFWNRRAARLRPLYERRTQWQNSLED